MMFSEEELFIFQADYDILYKYTGMDCHQIPQREAVSGSGDGCY
jgi:hypothetical protein